MLIAGHLGAGNLGDELMVQGLGSLLRDEGLEPLILRARAADWMDPRPDQNLASRFSARRWRARDRPLVLCGGTHYHDDDAGQSPTRNGLAMGLLTAQLVATPATRASSHLVSIGLGPLTRASSVALATQVVRRAATITVRDEPSLAEARALTDRPIPQVEDLALLSPALRAPALRALGSDRARSGVAIVPVPHPTDPTSSIPRASDLAPALGRFAPGDVSVVPLNRTDRNLRAAANLVEGLPGSHLFLPPAGPTALTDTIAHLAQRQLVISARYHGVVIAAALGVACIAVPYHRKVSDGAAQLGIPSRPGRLGPDDLPDDLDAPRCPPGTTASAVPSAALADQIRAIVRACG